MDSKKNDQVAEEQRELQELIELKKQKQAAAEHPEAVEQRPKQQEEELRPKTFKEKWDNYWYHYKLVTWLAVFVVFVVGWFVKDIFFGEKYDLVINIASKYTFSAINEEMGSDAAQYAEDYDGNGKKSVQVNEMQVNYDGTGGTNQTTMVGEQKILAVLNAGVDLVFILDKQTYDQLIGSNDGETIFTDLSEHYPDQPELVQGDKVLMKQTELGKKWRMDAVDSELYLCVRKIEGSVKDDQETREEYEDALNIVDHIDKGEATE